MKIIYLIPIIFVFSLASLPNIVSAVSCGDIITSNTVLTNDLLDCSTNGITIAADNITLDCNNHMIDGTKVPNTRGVFINSQDKCPYDSSQGYDSNKDGCKDLIPPSTTQPSQPKKIIKII